MGGRHTCDVVYTDVLWLSTIAVNKPWLSWRITNLQGTETTAEKYVRVTAPEQMRSDPIEPTREDFCC